MAAHTPKNIKLTFLQIDENPNHKRNSLELGQRKKNKNKFNDITKLKNERGYIPLPSPTNKNIFMSNLIKKENKNSNKNLTQGNFDLNYNTEFNTENMRLKSNSIKLKTFY